MVVERAAHLVAVDVGGLDGLLQRHAELDDVEEELQQVLVLRVAALHREREEGLAVLERELGVSVTRGRLPGSITLNGSFGAIEHEALHALAHADAGAPGDHRRNPAAAWRHRHHPAFRVGRV